LLTQSTPRVRMMSSYTAFTSALASEYSMSVTSDTLPSIGFGYINNVIEWLAGLDPQVLLLGFAVLGIALALRSWSSRSAACGGCALPAARFTCCSAPSSPCWASRAGLTAASLRTYQRLTHEQLAARVSIRQLGERHFALTLQPPAETPRQFEVRGDEWQIDARVLKWRGLATLAGFDTVYRLDRLSGALCRHRAGAQRASHRLRALAEPGLDLWSVLRRYNRSAFAEAPPEDAPQVEPGLGRERVDGARRAALLRGVGIAPRKAIQPIDGIEAGQRREAAPFEHARVDLPLVAAHFELARRLRGRLQGQREVTLAELADRTLAASCSWVRR